MCLGKKQKKSGGGLRFDFVTLLMHRRDVHSEPYLTHGFERFSEQTFWPKLTMLLNEP